MRMSSFAYHYRPHTGFLTHYFTTLYVHYQVQPNNCGWQTGKSEVKIITFCLYLRFFWKDGRKSKQTSAIKRNVVCPDLKSVTSPLLASTESLRRKKYLKLQPTQKCKMNHKQFYVNTRDFTYVYWVMSLFNPLPPLVQVFVSSASCC